MTPKEKAKELVKKYIYYVEAITSNGQIENAKKCALIAVDEILDLKLLFFQPQIDKSNKIKTNNSQVEYWVQVKKEIEIL